MFVVNPFALSQETLFFGTPLVSSPKSSFAASAKEIGIGEVSCVVDAVGFV